MSIGSRIKQRREELGYTQPQLAELVGVSKGAIGNYESNISSPNEKTLFRLFETLKCDANFLYQDDIDIDALEVFSSFERQQIKKYRTLDEHGKKIVDNILNLEYERCSDDKNKETVRVFKAARSTNGEAPGMVDIPKEKIERLKNAPTTDEKF